MSDPPRLPILFPDPQVELGYIRDRDLARERAQTTANGFSPFAAQGVAMVSRLAPHLEPGPALALGSGWDGVVQTAFNPKVDDATALSIADRAAKLWLSTAHLAATAGAGMQAESGDPALIGSEGKASALASGSPEARLDAAIRAADGHGLINSSGELVEPSRDDTSGRVIFDKLRRAFHHADQPLVYTDRDGETVSTFSPGNPDPTTVPRALADALDEAHKAGIIDPEGLVTEPARGTSAHRIFNDLRQQFAEADEDLPYVSSGGKAVVSRRVTRPRDTTGVAPHQSPEQFVERARSAGWSEQAIKEGLRELEFDVTYETVSRDEAEASDDPSTTDGLPAPKAAGFGIPLPVGQGLVSGAKGTARGATMTLDAPLQELTGIYRHLHQQVRDRGVLPGLFNPEIEHLFSQSDLGVALPRAIRGERVDTGSGWFVDPASDIAQERLDREARLGLVDGHRPTPGRDLASIFATADTKPYNIVSGLVDATAAVVLDPAGLALAGVGHAAKARKVFRLPAASDEALNSAGAINALRRTTHGPTARAWLDSRKGSEVLQAVANEPSPTKIWRATNRKVDPGTAATLAEQTDPADIRRTLEPMLGTTFRSTDELWRSPKLLSDILTSPTAPSTAARRLVSQTPGSKIDTFDVGQSMRELELWGINARVSDDVITRHLDTIARSPDRQQIYSSTQRLMSESDGALQTFGVTDPSVRSSATRLFNDTHEASQRYFVDSVGSDVPVWGRVLAGGEEVSGLGPHLSIELLDRYLPLPDYKEVRRLTSAFPGLFRGPKSGPLAGKGGLFATGSGTLRKPVSWLMHLQERVWKPSVLLRPAWTIFVVGDEQLRMAAQGRDSMFRHPLSYAAWVVGKRGSDDILGSPLAEAEAHIGAMTSVRGKYIDNRPDVVRTAQHTIYRKTPHEMPNYLDGWANELADLYRDPIARKVAVDGLGNDTLTWVLEGPGRTFLDELAVNNPGLTEPATARRYLESVSDRIATKTGGNDDLLQVVRTGRLPRTTTARKLTGKLAGEGDTIPALFEDGVRTNAKFKAALRSYVDDSGPERVKGQVTITAKSPLGRQQSAALDYLFGVLMSRPTNHLSRSPEFRQAYWQRVRELAPYARSRDDLAKHMPSPRWAEGVRRGGYARFKPKGADGTPLKPARRDSPLPPASERLSTKEIDELAKSYALDDVKGLLYDLSERNQLMDSMRLVVPFGEAWREVFTRWGKLTAESAGLPLRRGQQVVTAARSQGAGETLGAPIDPETGEPQGFFHENPFGEEVFVIPGTQWLSSKVTGVPIPLAGRVQGLAFMTDIYPGVGPAVQVPAAFITPERQQTQAWYRDLISPYGNPGEEGADAVTNLPNWLPGWARYAYTAATAGGWDPESDRRYANTVKSVTQYLHSTGEYDLSRTDEQARLLEDARDKARAFFMVRSLATAFTRGGVQPEFLMEADQGLVATHILTDAYHEYLEADPETADDRFLSEFGESVVLAMTSKSRTIPTGHFNLTPSTAYADWKRDHPDLIRDHPNVYGFFAPRDGEFDYAAYRSEFEDGTRSTLTPEAWLKLSNHQRAQAKLSKARRMVGPAPQRTDEQRAWLWQLEQTLHDEYPGFDDYSGLVGRANQQTLISELEGIVEDPEISSTDLGHAVSKYLTARDQFMATAAEAGYSTRRLSRAKAMAPMHAWLYNLATALMFETPEFAPVYRFVFESELMTEEFEEQSSDLALEAA